MHEAVEMRSPRGIGSVDGRDGTGGREYIERSNTNYKIAEKCVKVHSVAVMERTYSNSCAERWKLKLQ